MAAAQQQSSPSVLAVPIQTATPRRGPSRFLKVLCPISNPTPGPYAEPDEYISDSIDDEPATPFAPLQNVSFYFCYFDKLQFHEKNCHFCLHYFDKLQIHEKN